MSGSFDVERLRFSADSYTLTLPIDRPFVYLDDPTGRRIAELFVASSINSLNGLDDTTEIGEWRSSVDGDETHLTLECGSSVWKRKVIRFRCGRQYLSHEVLVEGHGRLTDVQYFGGYSSARPRWGSGFFLSGHTFTRGYNPEPNALDTHEFDVTGDTVIDLVGAPLPGKRHWFFNPPPFCFAFEAFDKWLSMGIRAEPGGYRFTEYRYDARGGFYLSLAYEGHTEVDGLYSLPSVDLVFGDTPEEVLREHVGRLPRSFPTPNHLPSWWTRPIFCGWGAQCHLAATDHGYIVDNSHDADVLAFVATMRYASSYARQDLYEGFLATLADHEIRPGTVVLDDKWQLTYGENEVDSTRWPDLRGFVDARHATGQHVLLWLKAWDREGVPDEECIVNAAGVPLTVDPTNPAFEARLRASVRRMLSNSGYDADGFKIDFTHRIPSGPGMRTHGDLWGLELMRRYLAIIHDEAKRAKSDALIMTHTPHPYLADVVDMIRLNDMLDLTALDDPAAGTDVCRSLASRARVARIACPDAVIDTDNWPVRNKAGWRDYVRQQPRVGVPSLYFVSHIDITQEPLEEADYRLIRETWDSCPPS